MESLKCHYYHQNPRIPAIVTQAVDAREVPLPVWLMRATSLAEKDALLMDARVAVLVRAGGA
jgi:hypothetical protein